MGSRLAVAVFFVGVGFAVTSSAEDSRAEAFALEAGKRVRDQPSVRGDDQDWFFLSKELRHVSAGQFWKKPWDEIAVNGTDPVDSIIEFNGLLKERGIDLLLVPVPAKAAIYPEKLAADCNLEDPYSTAPFLEEIREAGVNVLDLESRFRELRKEEGVPNLYCAQDAHFSPAAAKLVAGWIAEELEIPDDTAGGPFTLSEEATLTIVGDQIVGSEWEGKVATEELPLQLVLASGEAGIEPDDASPILLLGDSHTLVFHQGKASGMHTDGAGVLDHLSYRTGFPVALVGVRGSGLVQARKQLFYTATSVDDFWSEKKTVVWMFSVREFTQSSDRIISVPLDRG